MQYYEAAHNLSTIFFCPTVEMQLGFHVAFSQVINVFLLTMFWCMGLCQTAIVWFCAE